MVDLNIISNLVNKKNCAYVAFSGGSDSTALLYACSLLNKDGRLDNLKAIHINHNLSSNADLWENDLKNLCQDGIIFLDSYWILGQLSDTFFGVGYVCQI